MRRYAVIGKTGQLARALLGRQSEVVDILAYDRAALDLTSNENAITRFVGDLPDVHALILAAAYTQVDTAESHAELAHQVNAVAPGHIAKACAQRSLPLIYVSTDFVFGGNASHPYTPSDTPAPINVYGATKLAGERAIQDSECVSTILRTSWVYDGEGRNFLTTMLRLAREKSRIPVVADQTGRPTYAGDLADAVLAAAANMNGKSDLYHATGTGDPVSWHGFAQAIFDMAEPGLPAPVTAEPITTAEFGAAAPRPAYSVLDNSAFKAATGMVMPDWRESLRRVIETIKI